MLHTTQATVTADGMDIPSPSPAAQFSTAAHLSTRSLNYRRPPAPAALAPASEMDEDGLHATWNTFLLALFPRHFFIT
ncbi:MAG: hypothetical protein H6641_16130 [Caldilineaceae bacterium]|nr:hypothetical protein [Caldilineaceae bacterium]